MSYEETNLDSLNINYLTQSQYDTALANGEIEEDEIYLTEYEDRHVVGGTTLVTSVSNTSKTNVSSITLPAGIWIIVYQAALPLSSGKLMQATITTTYDISAEQQMLGASGICRLNLSAIVSPTSQTTYYGTMYHDNGSAVTVNTSTLSAIRIV